MYFVFFWKIIIYFEFNENGENILKALDDHEEDEVYGKYYELISLFEGEENE